MSEVDKKVRVYIEIEKDSNEKYELDKETGELVLDRMLPYPYYYPYSYGFITNTLAADGDELDALIVCDRKLEKDEFYDVYVVGVLIMEDEKGMDEKILCLLEEDYEDLKDLDDLCKDIRDNIHWFFSNYKSKNLNKWSKVFSFENKQAAIKLYEKYII